MHKQDEPLFSANSGFFGPRYLLTHAPSLSPEESLRQVEFLERALELKPGAKILDVPCGHGRHASALAKRGHDVLGVDLNDFFLEKAREDAARVGASARFAKADMRELGFDAEFDVALNIYTSLGYFDDDADDQKVVNGIGQALKAGGKFLLDFINRDSFVRNFRPRWERDLADGSRLVTEPQYDPLRGLMVAKHKVVRDSLEQEFPSLRYRMYSATELVNMAKVAGLSLRRAYGDFEGGDFTMDSKRVILVLEKI